MHMYPDFFSGIPQFIRMQKCFYSVTGNSYTDRKGFHLSRAERNPYHPEDCILYLITLLPDEGNSCYSYIFPGHLIICLWMRNLFFP